ncbi:phosphodiesterase [Plakobranchus ocellatus]|uniref:Phosphodiesterase n=1 Tax=Plakobranchus ocellatus TaxID=259542 RepID=A0AAV4BD72_9GAST|nr:phosphodiesterase [Plakobranchus ocellatus]
MGDRPDYKVSTTPADDGASESEIHCCSFKPLPDVNTTLLGLSSQPLGAASPASRGTSATGGRPPPSLCPSPGKLESTAGQGSVSITSSDHSNNSDNTTNSSSRSFTNTSCSSSLIATDSHDAGCVDSGVYLATSEDSSGNISDSSGVSTEPQISTPAVDDSSSGNISDSSGVSTEPQASSPSSSTTTRITYTLPTPPIDSDSDKSLQTGFDYNALTTSGTLGQPEIESYLPQRQSFSAFPGVGVATAPGAGPAYSPLHAWSLRSRALLSRGASYAVRKMSVAGGPGSFHHHGGGDAGGSGGGGGMDAIDDDLRREFDSMELWLDDHPEFVHDYFARKAHKSMVDGWLLAHALSGADNLSTSGTSSKASSGANTPVRKISAQDFERGGILNPIVSTVDGLPTFIGPSTSSTPTPSSKSRRRSKSELKALDEKELMYELVIDICNDLDVTSLCYKILQNLCILLNADRCSLFLVKGTTNKYLASKLFDVTSDSEFESVCDREDEIRIPLGTGIIGYVAKTGEVVNIPDAYEPVHNKVISGFWALPQAKAPVAGLEPATKGRCRSQGGLNSCHNIGVASNCTVIIGV